jgi:signal transduction histidine kinase
VVERRGDEDRAVGRGPPRAPRATIPTRIFLAFLAVLVAFGIVSVASVRQHQRTADTLRLLHEGYLELAIDLGTTKANEAVFETMVDRLDQERDPATIAWFGLTRHRRPAIIARALARVERADALAPEGDRAQLAELRTWLEAVRERMTTEERLFDDLERAQAREEPEQAAQFLGALRVHETFINRTLRDALRLIQQRIAGMSADAADAEARSVAQTAFLTVAALVIGLVLSFWARSLILPLTRLRERVVAVARGDLSRRFEGARDDEIGQLASEFERMVGAVAARDQQLRDAAADLRVLQETQEQIVASLRAAVLVIDGTGIVRTSNAAAESLLGVRESDRGSTLAALGIVERLAGLGGAIASVADGGARATLTATRLSRGDGARERFVDVVVTPFGEIDADAPGRSVLLVVDDVTDELHTKERLIQTERLAAMGRMAAHVTHEVRNPLSSIGLNVEMLQEELASSGAETTALLGAIQREVDRLTSITEEYLRLARLPVPRLEPEDPGALAKEVARFVAREMESTNVRLDVEVDEPLPLVAMDEAQIRQCILNLLRNAREAMPSGGRIVLAAHASEGGVSLSVEDEGEGIPDEQKERVFDVFFSTKERGTGLGLPLTREIVVAHQGRVRCDDAPGEGKRGTVFTLWLPAARTSAHEASEDAAHAETSDVEVTQGATTER